MSKLIIVIMEQNQYPFGGCENTYLQNRKVMVRKRVQFHPSQRKKIYLKAKRIKTLDCSYIIKLEQLLQQDSSIHLLFQYVPIKIQTWISNMSIQFINNFRLQLLELAQYLAQNGIVIDFKLRNIGMDQNYSPKYFIGLEYEISPLQTKGLLLEKYTADIKSIINPCRANIDKKKSKSLTEPNPLFALPKPNQPSKRQHQKQAKLSPNTKHKSRYSQNQKTLAAHGDTIKTINNLNEYEIKLTFDGSQKPLIDNVPKSASTNIKIQNIGKKISDLRSLIQDIGSYKNRNGQRKHDSMLLKPMKKPIQQRPNSSYQKQPCGSEQQIQIANNQKTDIINKIVQDDFCSQDQKLTGKQLRQTQSQSQYSGKLPNFKGLDRVNEKEAIQNPFAQPKDKDKNRNSVRVVGAVKQSYIFELQRLLDDDVVQFDTALQHKVQSKRDLGKDNSLTLGFMSAPISIQYLKTQPERFSYSHNIRKRKKSTQSSTSNNSQIKDRVNAALGASRKLINNFRKKKVS